jgi:hypothetical protein
VTFLEGLAESEIVKHRENRLLLKGLVGVRGVAKMKHEVGVSDFLKGAFEGSDQFMREVGDEADGVQEGDPRA